MIKTKIIGIIRDSSRYIVDMDIPMEWYDILEEHHSIQSEEHLSEIISTILMNHVNDLSVKKQIKKLAEDHTEKHEEYAKAAELRKQIYTGLKGDPQ